MSVETFSLPFGQRTRRGRCPIEQRGEFPSVHPNERANERTNERANVSPSRPLRVQPRHSDCSGWPSVPLSWPSDPSRWAAYHSDWASDRSCWASNPSWWAPDRSSWGIEFPSVSYKTTFRGFSTFIKNSPSSFRGFSSYPWHPTEVRPLPGLLPCYY